MAGGAVDSPSGGGGSGGQRNKDKQSMLSVNVKQVRSAGAIPSYFSHNLEFKSSVRAAAPVDCESATPVFVLKVHAGVFVGGARGWCAYVPGLPLNVCPKVRHLV